MLEDFFENYFKIEKAYRKYFQDEMEKYHLTPNELLVLLFLARDNGGCNTARDIAQYEGEKSCVFPQAGRRYSGGSDCDDGTDTAQVYGKYIRIY